MRKENWAQILSEKIEKEISTPFAWGVSDCLQFPSNVAAAMLDYDVKAKAQAHLYQYDSEEGARKIINESFNGDMGNVFDLVFNRINLKSAGRGDIVLVNFNDVIACGIIDSTGRRAAVKSEAGILFAPSKSWSHAWRVE